jgi:tetratricopeptide (TPR) repeat protein
MIALRSVSALVRGALQVVLCAASVHAGAGMFDDEEARRAILDVRQKLETQRRDTELRLADIVTRQADELTGLRRSLQELQNQLEASAAETAKLRGQIEQLVRDVAEAQRRQKEGDKALDERLRKFEPAKVSFEGNDFLADPQEKRAFEQALASFRKGEFDTAQSALVDLLSRYPQTGYANAALFWIGNAKFVGKDYKGALASFQKLLAQDAAYVRAPEALLALANCQLELKDTAGARKTLESLIAEHPRSEAADAAKERMARLK